MKTCPGTAGPDCSLEPGRPAFDTGEWWHLVGNAAREAVMLVSSDDTILTWNAGAAMTFGMEEAAAVGRSIGILLSPEGILDCRRAAERLRDAGRPIDPGFCLRAEARHPGGMAMPVEISIAVPVGSGLELMALAIRDISAQRRADLDYLRLVRAIEQTTETIVITDLDGVIVYVNPSFERITGYHRSEAIGRHVRIVTSGKHDQAFYERLWAALHRDDVWRGVFVNRKKDGSLYEEDATIALVRDSDGTPVNYMAIKRDITQQRQLEDQLRNAHKLEAVGSLAAGIAHEINTPLQYVGDSAQFLRRAFRSVQQVLTASDQMAARLADTPRFRSCLVDWRRVREEADLDYIEEEIPRAMERIMDGVGRVTTIVRAMKEFAHPGPREAGPSDLNRLVNTTLEVARNEYKQVADIRTELADLPPVQCNAGELNQVMLNLIVNAAQAIAERLGNSGARGLITLRTRLEDSAVTLEVEDTGTGVPDEIRHRIFDPFFTTKPPGQGTGQGLALARSIIVDRHHGQISCRNVTGGGARFTIRLPRTPATEEKEAAA